MKLIDENYDHFVNSGNDIYDQMFWLYNLDKRDFFLRRYDIWYNLVSETYILSIGKHIVKIPAAFFILIGDYDVGLDTISPNQIVGREFDAFTFASDMSPETWTLEPITVVGFENECKFMLPFTKNPYPVAISKDRAILVSSAEIWNKVKNLTFADIV